jgi:prolyl-tRNA synthetase
MALADCGEDTIFMSSNGEYKANKDIARAVYDYPDEPALALEKVQTPGKQSIEEVAGFLGVSPARTGKAVFYADDDDRLIFTVIRGDLEVNEVKLKNHLRVKELKYATDEQILAAGSVPGYASPMNIATPNVRIIFDPTAKGTPNLVVGANEVDYHYLNFNFERDMATMKTATEVVDIATVREGDRCPVTGQPLLMKRGIEVGNIFQLGTKYSQAMNCAYLDQNGQSQVMIMGCYGIGVGRAMAAVIEQCHDKYGPIWPFAIAPYHLHICALDLNKPGVRETAESLYQEFRDAGIETLYDDRGEKAGYMFNDADLIGVPCRLIVSPKNNAQNQVEFKTRDGSRMEMIALSEIKSFIIDLIQKLRADGG